MLIKQKFPIILASGSQIRKLILSNLGLEFTVIKPDFDEDAAKQSISNLGFEEQALFLAQNKALSVSVKYPDHLVIASDQICQLGSKAISKSKDKISAIKQLQELSGKTHYQNNAVCLYKAGKELISHTEKAVLKMRNLTKSEISAYVNADSSWNCAGSYKFESLGKHLFSEVTGSADCILGMAILPIINFLHQKQLIVIN